MIAAVRRYEYDSVVSQIEPILDLARQGDDMGMVHGMKILVPEFKSRNSIYQQVDKAIEQEHDLDFTAKVS